MQVGKPVVVGLLVTGPSSVHCAHPATPGLPDELNGATVRFWIKLAAEGRENWHASKFEVATNRGLIYILGI